MNSGKGNTSLREAATRCFSGSCLPVWLSTVSWRLRLWHMYKEVGEMMNRKDMVSLAKRAARLAVSEADNGDLSLKDYYFEYMSQLQGGNSQCLRTWIGTEVENGVHEAIDILKLWIRAELRRCVR